MNGRGPARIKEPTVYHHHQHRFLLSCSIVRSQKDRYRHRLTPGRYALPFLLKAMDLLTNWPIRWSGFVVVLRNPFLCCRIELWSHASSSAESTCLLQSKEKSRCSLEDSENSAKQRKSGDHGCVCMMIQRKENFWISDIRFNVEQGTSSIPSTRPNETHQNVTQNP